MHTTSFTFEIVFTRTYGGAYMTLDVPPTFRSTPGATSNFHNGDIDDNNVSMDDWLLI